MPGRFTYASYFCQPRGDAVGHCFAKYSTYILQQRYSVEILADLYLVRRYRKIAGGARDE